MMLLGTTATTSLAYAPGNAETAGSAHKFAPVAVPALLEQECTAFEVDETALWFEAVDKNDVDTDQVVDSYKRSEYHVQECGTKEFWQAQ